MELPVYAKDEILERVDGDKDFLIELTDEFLKSFPEQYKELQSHFIAKDSHKLKQKAHSLKGALRNLGAMKSGDVAFQIETLASKGDLSNLESIINNLKNCIEEFSNAYQDFK